MTTPPLNRPVGYHSKEFWDRFAEEKRREQTRSIRETEVKAAQADLALARARMRDIVATAKMVGDTKTEIAALLALHKLNAPLLVPPKNRDVYMGDPE
jgi:hypothetical protein